jgi:hypothetical protein
VRRIRRNAPVGSALPRLAVDSSMERSIRFVAQDSQGQCYLWAMRWGDAGYSCRSTRLTAYEAETLYRMLYEDEVIVSRSSCDVFGVEDPSPRHASFAREENAQQFFVTDRDADLRRWAAVMFRGIREAEPS